MTRVWTAVTLLSGQGDAAGPGSAQGEASLSPVRGSRFTGREEWDCSCPTSTLSERRETWTDFREGKHCPNEGLRPQGPGRQTYKHGDAEVRNSGGHLSPMGKLCSVGPEVPRPSLRKGTAAPSWVPLSLIRTRVPSLLLIKRNWLEVRRDVQARLYWGPCLLAPWGWGSWFLLGGRGERCVQDSGHGGAWVVCPALSWWCVCSTKPFRSGSWDLFVLAHLSVHPLPQLLEKRSVRRQHCSQGSQGPPSLSQFHIPSLPYFSWAAAVNIYIHVYSISALLFLKQAIMFWRNR